MKSLKINGQDYEFSGDLDTPLLWAIRDHAGLTATKFGCGMAQCGACTVLINGQPTRSCVMPVAAISDQEITTLEGLQSKEAVAVQEAWRNTQVAQCGYCQSGQVVAATALLSNNPNPSDADIDAAMSGNLCRCGTYGAIREGIKEAAKSLDVATMIKVESGGKS